MKKANRIEDHPALPTYTLFLGCTVPVRAMNYEIAARRVAARLDLSLQDVPEFRCCGYPVKSVNRYAFLLMAARNLAFAEKKGNALCTLCSSCCASLTEANHEIQEDGRLRSRINEDLASLFAVTYAGSVRITHFTEVLHQVGRERIAERTETDLSSLRVAPHYGCHYTKPSSLHGGGDDPENPRSLDELIEAAGARPVRYEDKLQCCGGGVLAMDEQVALAMAGRKLDHVQAAKADALVLICPFCNVMYESNQRKIEKAFQKEYKLPVLFYPQLLGLALGLEPDELGFKMNRVKATEVLKKVRRRGG